MANVERSSGEKWGGRIRNGGIIAGAIGLVLMPELILPGITLAVAGEIYRSRSEKSKGE